MSLHFKLTQIVTAALLLLPGVAMAERAGLPSADNPEARGKAIAEITDATDLGFGDTTSEMEMVLTNANGDQTSVACALTRLRIRMPVTATGQ